MTCSNEIFILISVCFISSQMAPLLISRMHLIMVGEHAAMVHFTEQLPLCSLMLINFLTYIPHGSSLHVTLLYFGVLHTYACTWVSFKYQYSTLKHKDVKIFVQS